MKAWFRCVLVDTDPPCVRVVLCVVDAADRETADKRCRAKFPALFRRLSTNKFRLEVEPCPAPSRAPDVTRVDRGAVMTDQIFSREQAP